MVAASLPFPGSGAMPLEISVTATPADADVAVIDQNLTTFNEAEVGPQQRMLLTVLVRDGNGAVAAGINGMTSWGWLYVQRLWVGESLRGQGVAARMLAAAEAEALKRGCHSAYIDTFNPVALKTYQRHGFVEYGRLKDFVAGRDRIFLQKKL
ncbi:GNAT family N-acetyltransferase [Martelella endophytica]